MNLKIIMKPLQLAKNVQFPTPKTYINKIRIGEFVKHSLINRLTKKYSFLVRKNPNMNLLPYYIDALIAQLKNRGKLYKSINKLFPFLSKFKSFIDKYKTIVEHILWNAVCT